MVAGTQFISMRSFFGAPGDRHHVEPLHERGDLADVVIREERRPGRHRGVANAVLDDPEELALAPFTLTAREKRCGWVERRPERARDGARLAMAAGAHFLVDL